MLEKEMSEIKNNIITPMPFDYDFKMVSFLEQITLKPHEVVQPLKLSPQLI